MRQLLFNAEPQTCFPSDRYEAIPDFTSPLAVGLHSLWLPSGPEPRSSTNPFHLNGKRDITGGEFSVGYFRRRFEMGAALSGLTIAPGSGGNVATPFGNAFAYSNEQAACRLAAWATARFTVAMGPTRCSRCACGFGSIASTVPDIPR